MYKSLDPGIRVVILKALCDIRVEVIMHSIINSTCIFQSPLSLLVLWLCSLKS